MDYLTDHVSFFALVGGNLTVRFCDLFEVRFRGRHFVSQSLPCVISLFLNLFFSRSDFYLLIKIKILFNF